MQIFLVAVPTMPRSISKTAPIDLYLVYMTLLNNLPRNDTGPFFLRHTEPRDVNFWVDDDFNITGITDWELSIVTSKSSAFQSPLLMYSLGELYGGSSAPSKDEFRLDSILRGKGATDLAGLSAGKLPFRIDLVLETNTSNDDFRGLFGGWWSIINNGKIFD